MQPTILSITCYGVAFRIGLADEQLADDVLAFLPHEFSQLSEVQEPARACTLSASTGEGWLCSLAREVDAELARRSKDWLFVRAGVVGWRGTAIVIPGGSGSGKATLVDAFVRHGATYYSDEYAVFDTRGYVCPYTRRFAQRDALGRQHCIDLAAPGEHREPMPPSLVLATHFRPLASWGPIVKRGFAALLPLIDNTILARSAPERVLGLSSRLVASVVTLQGPRPECEGVARWVLDLLDEALSDREAQGGWSAGLASRLADLARARLANEPSDAVPAAPVSVSDPTTTGTAGTGLPVCFVHLGDHAPPEHLLDAIDQVQLHNPASRIFVALARRHVADFLNSLHLTKIISRNVACVALEELRDTEHHARFRETHGFDEQFRNGFWRYTTERFFVLEELAKAYGLEDVVHLENDMMVYCDLGVSRKAFRKTGDCALTSDSPDRVVPGLIYFRGHEVLHRLNARLADAASDGLTDMVSLALFLRREPQRVGTLPLVMPTYESEAPPRCSDGFDLFGSIFDGCAIGQYLGGIDPRNSEDSGSTAGFVNETAAFSCNLLEFRWSEVGGLRVPACRPRRGASDRLWTPINNLHIHSKALHHFSSRIWLSPDEIVTGERLQRLADVSIISRSGCASHQACEGLAGEAVHMDSYEDIDEATISRLSLKRSFFVPTQDLPEFVLHVWPRLRGSGYALITHNSDDEVNAQFRTVLEDDRLETWLAQNATIAHPKLVQLPIGIANSMWPHGSIATLHDAIARHAKHRKTELVHMCWSVHTHPDRMRIWSILRRSFTHLPALPPAPQSFSAYLDDMARHRFAVCPRGNGIDTHRLWEALYLGVIPVVERSIHTEYWQHHGLPMVLVDDWPEVTPERLLKEASLHESRSHTRAPLVLSYYRARALRRGGSRA